MELEDAIGRIVFLHRKNSNKETYMLLQQYHVINALMMLNQVHSFKSSLHDNLVKEFNFLKGH